MRGRLMSGGDRTIRYSLKEKVSKQLEHMHNLVNLDDVTCLDHLRMNRNTFGHLCFLLENVGGLVPTRHVQLPEQVVMFLSMLAHHTKNRIVKYNFKWSGYTINDSTNDRWKFFKGCLGALDGTYIPEGSAVDSRVLRDAITRPNGLKVPTENYYLCDGGYTNANSFLAPYRGVRYHLQEWDGASSGPINSQEYFNLKHAKARNNQLKMSGWKRTVGAENKSEKTWFRTGYLGLLEQHMLQAIPGNDLKAEPHIISKIHTDNNARTIRSKSWPLYKDWCEIFGKDRATGEHAETFADVVQDLLQKDEESMHTSTGNDYAQFISSNQDEEIGDDFMSMSREGTSSSTKMKGKGKKRKSLDSLDECFCEKNDSKMGDLVQRIGFEHDASLSMKKVYEALGNINHLTDEEQIYVVKSLCNNTKDLDLFFSLPDEKKVVMVRMILNGKI
ncbi:hypothetical protein C2S53_016611 [Perilla frutescens var. hirtella]|uniref:DUF8040 domain-containing protein n=1 Tax=Perilla frutescens var. hirtella TaxID=608512 RepID=A0AAD4J479_PERFH|nr:hypothetical protein C2S53_016611 [Perilla frutescens var. hirtella]